MEQEKKIIEPDNTAARVALWRALHIQADKKPYIVEDEIGLRLIAPDSGWQERPDMKYTKRLRASIVARTRFIEDLALEQIQKSVTQYVILGAGLDTFAQRRPDAASAVHIYEIDQAGTLEWKRYRLTELGFDVPKNLHFVAVDFEKDSWSAKLIGAGFDITKPAIIACTGVTLYLTKDAITDTLKQITKFAHGSSLAMTFYLSVEWMDEEDRPLMEMSIKGAHKSGTPMISFFSPDEIIALAKEAGFKTIKTISTKDMEKLYFAGREDNLLPASGEVFLMAEV